MSSFAFVFRASSDLSPEDLARRNAAARDWALARQADGALQLPAPFEGAGAIVSSAGTAPISDLASVLVIDAPDLDAALALARSHPGLAFGTTIEVRPIKATPPAR